MHCAGQVSNDGEVRSLDAARARRRFIYFVVFVVGTGILAAFHLRGVTLTAEAVRAQVAAWDPFGPAVLILLLTARPFFFFPSTLLFIAAGLAFGPVLGTLYAATGATAAAIITFLLARALGREFVQAWLPGRLRRLQEDRWGIGLVFLLNLVPLVPITAVNYGAGLSGMSLGHYAMGAIAGLTPRIFAYSYFGDSLDDVGSPKFVLALALLGLLVVVPTWLRRQLRS